ncbi:RNA methyltransferase [Pseudoduganella sp. DS3]|uniref:RNA methyltransferase n=1 Tax=Pseudoduganella guangdongensis TaxID=2692179 RepID=A0A6N9HKI7_9BURK|nr:RNA methyltransferase [Pseudoduganella guangdongensis]MYN04010.1 RNA methyltransferase [Pseudoduganella guangdongensis]
MKHITSRDNAQYKEIAKLATNSQARRKAGRSLLDGVHLCETWLELRGHPLQAIVAEGALQHAEVGPLVRRLEAEHAHILCLPDQLYHGISQVEHGVGLMFLIDTPEKPVPAALSVNAVLLDNVQDPGNVGSILRSAAAAGVKEVYCAPGTAFCWSPKVLRAAMGAHFVLDIYENVDLAALQAGAGIATLATSGYAAEQLYQLDLKRPVAWIFGHEGQGVSDALLSGASHRVLVPHLGKVESLNVAACAAVCFFEQVRQNLG